MSTLPTCLTFGVGGTVYIDLLDKPSSNVAYVDIVTGDSTAIVSNAAATVSNISSTTSAAVSIGATSVNVANAANITAGDVFYIRTPDEQVRAKSISGNTVTIWSPTLYAHANNVAVESTRVSYTVAAANCTTLFWDGRARWNISNGALIDYTAVECTKYPMQRRATVQDLYDLDPMINTILPSNFDAERALDNAHDEVLKRIGGQQRIRVFTGSSEFVRATCLACLRSVFLSQTGDEAERLYKRMSEELEAEIGRITAIVPRDENQDGTITAGEKYHHFSVRLVR